MAVAETVNYKPSKSEIRLLKKIGGLVEELTDFQIEGDAENYTLDFISRDYLVKRLTVQDGKIISIEPYQ